MTYSYVFPLVNGQVAARWPRSEPTNRRNAHFRAYFRAHFQRVDSTKPTMIKPKPTPMFHTPMPWIG